MAGTLCTGMPYLLQYMPTRTLGFHFMLPVEICFSLLPVYFFDLMTNVAILSNFKVAYCSYAFLFMLQVADCMCSLFCLRIDVLFFIKGVIEFLLFFFPKQHSIPDFLAYYN